MSDVMSPKQYKSAYFEVVADVENKLLRVIGEKLKDDTLDLKLMNQIKEASRTYHSTMDFDLTKFKKVMNHINKESYTEIDVIALLRYFNGKYPAITLRNMYKVHPMYDNLYKGAKKLHSGDFNKDQFKGEKLSKDLMQYTLGKLVFTVPVTNQGREEILEAALLWLNEKKARSFEFVEVETMVAVHGG